VSGGNQALFATGQSTNRKRTRLTGERLQGRLQAKTVVSRAAPFLGFMEGRSGNRANSSSVRPKISWLTLMRCWRTRMSKRRCHPGGMNPRATQLHTAV
jgi:hypothetical protein